jgi:16S rRNA (uracil1498-N3)-methyltransferase
VRVSRVYVDGPLASGARVRLSGSAAAHVTRVLRLRPGAELTLFNGAGGEFTATLESAAGGGAVVAVGAQRRIERESPLPVTLAQGIARGERMDFVIQKATELGVRALVPVLSARSVVRLSEAQLSKRLAHWRAIALAACEQSGRNRPPELRAPLTVAELARASGAPTRLLLSPEAGVRLADIAHPSGEVLLLVGPEGGLTKEEIECAAGHGFVSARLGPRVLRTETAALVALALLQRQFGDL